MTRLMDNLAIALSALCVLHCLALPILLIGVPSVLTGTEHTDLTHVILFLIALPLSGFAMVYGYRVHKKLRYGVAACFGILALGAGLMLHGLAYELYITLLGAVILAAAHLGNRAATRLSA